jgi:hypothetical protein
MPGDADLDKLAAILEHWRLVFHDEEKLHLARGVLQRKASRRLEKLSDVVSELVELDTSKLQAAAHDNNTPPGLLSVLRNRLADSERVYAGVKGIGSRAELALYKPAMGWKWLADELPEDFINAMKPNNPEFSPGLSYSGPVARFIAVVVPLLTGEHPTPASVATQLKLRRQANRKTRSSRDRREAS